MKKHNFLILSCLALAGCQPAANIVEKYDEFTKTKVCKLEPYRIKFEGFNSSRTTLISFEKEADSTIKAIISNDIINRYETVSDNARLEFTLTNNNRAERFTFKGHSFARVSGYTITYGTPIPLRLPTKTASIVFNLSKSQLEKMTDSQKVSFFFEAGEEPIEGEFSKAQQDAFKEFLKKCYSSSS